MNERAPDQRHDYKFVSRLLLIVFDGRTLSFSSVYGRPGRNGVIRRQLDLEKIRFVKGTFVN